MQQAAVANISLFVEARKLGRSRQSHQKV